MKVSCRSSLARSAFVVLAIWLVLGPLYSQRLCADEDSPALKALREKLRETTPKLADEFDKRLKQSREELERFKRGHLVFGRVELEGGGEPRTVVAQMIILEEGYFVDAIGAADKPIGFRRTGYENVVVTPKGAEPDEDLGTIQLKKLGAEQFSSISGQVEIEPHPKRPKSNEVILTWDIRPDPINTPGNGYEGYSGFYSAITTRADDEGKFSVNDLSPGTYNFHAKAPHCVVVHRNVLLQAGKTRKMVPVQMELVRKMNVEFAVSENGDFNDVKFEKTTLKADDRWRASNKTPEWAFDLLIGQKEQQLLLEYRYGPCHIMDLGAHKFEDELQIDENQLNSVQPQNIPVHEGHIYVILHRTWNQWILLRTTEVGKIADID